MLRIINQGKYDYKRNGIIWLKEACDRFDAWASSFTDKK